MRLDKLLSHSGFGSRKEVKALVRTGIVFVNGQQIKNGKFNVNETTDLIEVGGEKIVYQKYFYYLLNKPVDVISATEDQQHPTVIDLLEMGDFREDLFPVGRLDKDTTGFLMLTNDGKLSHQLLSPRRKVPKTYLAEIYGLVTAADQEKFKAGLTISGDEKCLPADLEIVAVNENEKRSTIRLTIVEGKYHQVKRMFEAVGKQVTRLHRESMGPLTLDDDLASGQYREMTTEEVEQLKKD